MICKICLRIIITANSDGHRRCLVTFFQSAKNWHYKFILMFTLLNSCCIGGNAIVAIFEVFVRSKFLVCFFKSSENENVLHFSIADKIAIFRKLFWFYCKFFLQPFFRCDNGSKNTKFFHKNISSFWGILETQTAAGSWTWSYHHSFYTPMY